MYATTRHIGLSTLFLLFSFLYGTFLFAREPIVTSGRGDGLRFTENKGQWDARVKYRVGLPGGALFLENDRLTYSFIGADENQCKHPHPCEKTSGPQTLRGHAYYARFIGANPKPAISPENAYSDYENFFIGDDPTRWASRVLSYQKLKYQNLYPGIDMKLYFGEGRLKYDFILAPGANPALLQTRYEGPDRLSVENGMLVVQTSVNKVVEETPLAYQTINGERRIIACAYRLSPDGKTVGFSFPKGYDSQYPLIIDPPVLVFCTYTGSTADNWGFTATYDVDGAFYSGGIVHDVGYPTSPGAFQTNFQGGNGSISSNESVWYSSDVGLIKYSADGTARIWATYLGGNSNEQPHSLIANDNKELYILGTTRSPNFPTKSNSYDKTFNGEADIFVSKLSADGGALLASTFIGGSGFDGLNLEQLQFINNPLYHFYADDSRGEIILDEAGNPCIVSSTASTNFPMSANAFQNQLAGKQDACVFKFDPALSALQFSTYLGGTNFDAGYSMKIDSQGDFYLVGGTNSQNSFPSVTGGWIPSAPGGPADGYIIHLKSDGSAILNSTFIGTNKYDQVYLIDLDENNNVYFIGQTEGNYPILNAPYAQNNAGQFITKLNPQLNAVEYSTRFGKANAPNAVKADITPTAFLVDICQNVYVSGWGGMMGQGNMDGLYISSDAFRDFSDGEDFYLFVLKANAESVLYATYFGGTESHDHVDGGTSRFDKNGIVYQAVCASCGGHDSDFPVTPGAWSTMNKSDNCNNGAFKFKFDLLDATTANLEFSVETTAGCTPFTVHFTNESLGAESYHWNLGDGNQSTEVNPVHVYPNPGIYTVELTAINANKCNKSDSTTVDIYVYAPSQAQFSAIMEPCSKSVVFKNETINGTTFLWLFGDGSSSSDSLPPPHTYPSLGQYTVTLVVNPNTACADTVITTINVGLVPEAAFTTSAQPCQKTVAFNNASQNAQNYKWIFNNSGTSVQVNPSYTFPGPGTFPVRLIANPTSPCPDTLDATVTIDPPSVAAFTNAPADCDRTIHPENLSENATQYVWNFGDGSALSSEINPTHTYAASGTYSVTLIVEPNKPFCSDTTTAPILVPVLVNAAFSYTAPPCALNLSFTEEATGFAVDYQWNFGDGGNANVPDPQHTYVAAGNYPVTLTVNPDSLCPSSITQSIVIVPKSIANFYFTPELCTRNVFFAFEGQNAELFQWSLGDGTTANSANVSHTYLESGNYIVTLISNPGGGLCADTMQAPLFIPILPHAEFSAAPPTCDSLVVFTNNSIDGFSYEWQFGDGQTSTGINPTYAFPDTGYYNVTLVVNPDSVCPSTYSQTVHIFAAPQAKFNVAPLQCTRTVNVENLSVASQTYTWNFGDGTTAVDFQPEHTYLTSNTYPIKLVVNGLNGCIDTLTQNVTLPILPHAEFYAMPPSCDSTVVFFDNSIDGFSYQWQFGDGETSLLANPTYAYSDTGFYNVTLIVNPDSACPSVFSETVHIFAAPQAKFASSPAQCLRNISLQNLSIAANKFIWSFGDGDTSTKYAPDHAYLASGTYQIQLIVTGTAGCADTVMQTVTIADLPHSDFIFSPPDCDGNVAFQNAASGASTYQWRVGDSTVSVATNAVYRFPGPGYYLVTLVINADTLCSDVSQKSVFIPQKPEAAFTTQTLPCTRTILFNADSSQITTSFKWDFGNGNVSTEKNPSFTFSETDTFSVRLIVDSELHCPDTLDKMVAVNPIPTADFQYMTRECENVVKFLNKSTNALTYLWDFGDGQTSTAPNPNHIFPFYGNYPVTLMVNADSPCPALRTYRITVPAPPAANFTVQQLPCDSVVTFQNISEGARKRWWKFGDGSGSSDLSPTHVYSAPGVYTVTLIDDPQTSCPDSFKTQVRIPFLSKAIFSDSAGRCEKIVYFKSKGSTNALNYQWTINDSIFSTEANPIFEFPAFGKYNITLITNPDSLCPGKTVREVTVGLDTRAEFKAPQTVCDSTKVSFNNLSINALHHRWDFGDGTRDTVFAPLHVFPGPGVYTVTLVADSGTLCEKKIQKQITVTDGPSARFEISQEACGSDVYLTNLSTNGAVRYVWELGDGRILTTPNAVVTYPKADKYRIRLRAIDALGCVDYADSSYIYDPDGNGFLGIPNVFSPNGDGHNDEWRIYAANPGCVQGVVIFDRWGTKIFETSSYQHHWDGTFDGKPVPEGVFIYVLKIGGRERVGSVTVIR